MLHLPPLRERPVRRGQQHFVHCTQGPPESSFISLLPPLEIKRPVLRQQTHSAHRTQGPLEPGFMPLLPTLRVKRPVLSHPTPYPAPSQILMQTALLCITFGPRNSTSLTKSRTHLANVCSIRHSLSILNSKHFTASASEIVMLINCMK